MSKNKKEREKQKASMSTITMVTALVILLGIGIFALTKSFLPQEQKEEAVQHFSYEGQPSIGDPNAPVKLVEFGDFKCPACKMFHDVIYPQLKKDYIDTGKVQMVFVNYQFLGPDSITAGIAGEAIYKQNNDAFWKYYDAIYFNQGDKSTQWATPAFILDLVKKNIPEVNVEQLSKDLENKTYEQDVKADNQLARKSKVDFVPAVFVNGKKVEQSLDYEQLKKAIEAELAKK